MARGCFLVGNLTSSSEAESRRSSHEREGPRRGARLHCSAWVRPSGAGRGRARCARFTPRDGADAARAADGRADMASRDPLKSVLSIGGVADTSLALPSVKQLSSGQQRVREQVQSVRRSRSRHLSSRSGSSSLSPTSKSRTLEK